MLMFRGLKYSFGDPKRSWTRFRQWKKYEQAETIRVAAWRLQRWNVQNEAGVFTDCVSKK
ncbi:hypothetical protein PthBH41_17540 [Parageobacillus thermoglucosidasius]|nr:hypothetical protein PthBH41_17540 [Parageobacillus thermoglucosidasius]